ncbi:MAG: hypothetical protein L3J71_18355, partial [Victivallaceae bacterium]|nr:hypothetical protein [Victivallaceae bacterium]
MMNTLILTGWGWIDYATAAAVALRYFRTADILGMSRRRLPEYLAELADGEFDYKQIIIIGIGLNKDQELMPILKRLKTQQVNVIWLSVLPLSPQLPSAIKKYLDIQFDLDSDGLTEFISEYYSQPAADLLKVRNVEYQSSTATKDNLARYLLTKSAQYRYRNYQDNAAYGAAIRTLAEKSSLTQAQEAMIKHYRKYGQRE